MSSNDSQNMFQIKNTVSGSLVIPKIESPSAVDEFKNAVVAPRSNCVLNSDKLEKVFQMIPAKMAMLIAAKKYYEVSE